MYAAQHGNDAVLQVLVKAGGDVCVADEEGWTALMSAALTGHSDTVMQLLECKADPDAKRQVLCLLRAVPSSCVRGSAAGAL